MVKMKINPLKLKFLMLARSYSNNKLAEAVGVSGVYISQLRCGKRQPSKSMMILLASTLQTTVEDLQSDN